MEGIGMIAQHALAKLTLSLRILGKREDGFNNLEALTVFLPSVNDVVHVEENDVQDFVISSPQHNLVSLTKDNLVIRARDAYLNHERILDKDNVQFRILLEKVIPLAAGLGGGSADAAATLNALNRYYDYELTPTELGWLAEELGSDVPACVYSQASWMKGRGEIVDPLDDFYVEDIVACVVTPDIECSTPAIFARYDEMGRPHDEGVEAPVAVRHYVDTLHNDLSLAAYDVFPELAELKRSLRSATDQEFMMAGSGSTLFCLVDTARVDDIQDKINGLGYSLRLGAFSEMI